MKSLFYEFTELDNEASVQDLVIILEGEDKGDTIRFDNEKAKGELSRKSFNEGLFICKWKLNVATHVRIRKLPSAAGEEKRLTLLYVLSSSDVLLRNNHKKIRIRGSRNNLFWSNRSAMDFDIHPKRPFHLFEISFSSTWLMHQLDDADPNYKKILEEYINSNEQKILIEPLTIDEYKTLHELEASMFADHADDLFIRARAYAMLCNFFGKLDDKNDIKVSQASIQFEQIIEAELMILEDIKKAPRIDAIAKKVNMSVSSLLRKFKLIYGKSIHEYYVDKKMELARKMIIENRLAVKEMASLLGYNQASAFIERFTRQHGYSPGTLKQVSNHFMFF